IGHQMCQQSRRPLICCNALKPSSIKAGYGRIKLLERMDRRLAGIGRTYSELAPAKRESFCDACSCSVAIIDKTADNPRLGHGVCRRFESLLFDKFGSCGIDG